MAKKELCKCTTCDCEDVEPEKGKTCDQTKCPDCGSPMQCMSNDDNGDEAKKTHGPSGRDWGPKTEKCIQDWHNEDPKADKSLIIATCRKRHKDE